MRKSINWKTDDEMKNQNSMQPDGVFRNSALITGRMRKSAHTYIAGAIGMAAVTAGLPPLRITTGYWVSTSCRCPLRCLPRPKKAHERCPAARKGEPF